MTKRFQDILQAKKDMRERYRTHHHPIKEVLIDSHKNCMQEKFSAKSLKVLRALYRKSLSEFRNRETFT